jgi:hypothetical protein
VNIKNLPLGMIDVVWGCKNAPLTVENNIIRLRNSIIIYIAAGIFFFSLNAPENIFYLSLSVI